MGMGRVTGFDDSWGVGFHFNLSVFVRDNFALPCSMSCGSTSAGSCWLTALASKLPIFGQEVDCTDCKTTRLPKDLVAGDCSLGQLYEAVLSHRVFEWPRW